MMRNKEKGPNMKIRKGKVARSIVMIKIKVMGSKVVKIGRASCRERVFSFMPKTQEICLKKNHKQILAKASWLKQNTEEVTLFSFNKILIF